MTSTQARSGALRPLHDRVTSLSFAQLALFAWFMYGVGSTVALLRDEQGTSNAIAGLHSTALAVSGIISALLASGFVHRWGRGAMLRLASAGVVAGVVIYTWPGASFPVTFAGMCVVGFAGTLLVVVVNAFLLVHQQAAGPSALTEANAIASVSGLIAPLVVGALASTILGWRTGVLVVAVGLVIVEIARGRDLAPYAVGEENHADHRGARLPRRVFWSLALIVCFLAAEFSTVYWSADLLRERAGFSPAAAAASLSAVTAGMAIGRFAGARLAERISSDLILRWSVVIAIIGFAVSWAGASGAIIITGLAIAGLGMGVHWPLTVARAVRASGGMADRAAALASVSGSIAIATAPFALGLLSDAVGFHAAFLLLPALLVIALVILLARPEPG